MYEREKEGEKRERVLRLLYSSTERMKEIENIRFD